MKKSRLSLLPAIAFVVLLGTGCSGDSTVEPWTYEISGMIAGPSEDIEGVIIAIPDKSVGSINDGTYTISELLPGTYNVVPEKQGFYFDPEAIGITITDQSVGNVNFQIYTESDIQYNGSAWQQFNQNIYTVRENLGSLLQLDLAENGLWYQNDQGGLVYQLVNGDFTISGIVSVRRSTDDSQEVVCDVCLGGLMVRNPDNSTGENYVHLVTGNTPEGIGVENKTTVNGKTDFDATNDGHAEFELQISRVGDDFNLSKREPGSEEWVFVTSYSRPDLPETLQVGINIYTAASGKLADLSVIYENIKIDSK